MMCSEICVKRSPVFHGLSHNSKFTGGVFIFLFQLAIKKNAIIPGLTILFMLGNDSAELLP